MTEGKEISKVETLEIIKALIEFSYSQNRPIENTIDEFMPYIVQGSSYRKDQFHEFDKRLFKVENTAISFSEYLNKNAYDDKIHDLDKRLSNIEIYPKHIEINDEKLHDLDKRLSNIETSIEKKMELLARKLFWKLLGASIAILATIATLIKILSTL